MLPDYMFEWQKNLWRRLCDGVKADISCKIIDDTLHVDIVRGSTNWHYGLYDMEARICEGLSTELVYNAIIREFKKFLFNGIDRMWFFKKEEENERL